MSHLVTCQRIVTNSQAEQEGGDGVWIDVQSANLYVTIHERLSEANRERLEAMPLHRAVLICWKLTKVKG